jgi:hypothetical protein
VLRKSLTGVALLFIVAMIVNTMIALHYRWPAMFDAPGNPATIETDFIWYGTRISPPVPAMIAFTLLALAALWRGWRGVVATVLIVALCALMTIAGAGEPAGLPANDLPRWAWLILGTIGGFAPLLVAGLGISELVRRLLTRNTKEGAAILK